MCFLPIPKGVQGNLLITVTCLINRKVTLVSRIIRFVEKGEHLIMVLLCKGNLDCKEIRASDLLKPIFMSLTFFFIFYIPDLALFYKNTCVVQA